VSALPLRWPLPRHERASHIALLVACKSTGVARRHPQTATPGEPLDHEFPSPDIMLILNARKFRDPEISLDVDDRRLWPRAAERCAGSEEQTKPLVGRRIITIRIVFERTGCGLEFAQTNERRCSAAVVIIEEGAVRRQFVPLGRDVRLGGPRRRVSCDQTVAE
jgi:hypothetical protein